LLIHCYFDFANVSKDSNGTDSVTPNMHMHCHLAQCIHDFGPLTSFWLFPFERYNGTLEQTPTNNRSVEVQVMQRFLVDIHHLSLLHSTDENVISLFTDVVIKHSETFQSTSSHHRKHQMALKQPPIVTFTRLLISPAPKHKILVLSKL